MTAVATPAGAVSRNEVDWHASNWQKAPTIVRRLQARIVKATQVGRGGKVRALQRLLTHAFSAKAVAVKRVTEHHGLTVVKPRPQRRWQGLSCLKGHFHEPFGGGCALQVHTVQPSEMAALTKPSQQSGTESCVVYGNVPGEA